MQAGAHILKVIDVVELHMRFSDLKQREVINCKDCKRLGFVSDVVFDSCNGKIEALIVPGPGKFLGCFCPVTEYVIKFCRIVRIGPDIILVDIDLVEALEKKKEHI